mmetsp:Transcript_4248/g.9509  ORF Transcript_4248/g.9509 Transcript_4248/m.9509 type:complete len:170 (-) Transcript_4248:36-545(-)
MACLPSHQLICGSTRKQRTISMAMMQLLRQWTSMLTVNSVKSLGAFCKLTCTDLEQYDFVSLSGQAAYLADMTPTSVIKKRFEKSYFICRLDGLRHATIACVEGSYCQYCAYQWNNEFNDVQKQAWGFMRKNRTKIQRCLVCNVNLCPNCLNKFHDISMQDNAKLLGRH